MLCLCPAVYAHCSSLVELLQFYCSSLSVSHCTCSCPDWKPHPSRDKHHFLNSWAFTLRMLYTRPPLSAQSLHNRFSTTSFWLPINRRSGSFPQLQVVFGLLSGASTPSCRLLVLLKAFSFQLSLQFGGSALNSRAVFDREVLPRPPWLCCWHGTP